MMDGPMTEMEEAISGLLKQKEQARMDKIKEDNSQLKKHITRGGFIQDRNGRWCKDGDKVLVKNANRGIDENLPCKLYWDKDEYQFRLEQDGILFGIEDTFIRLVEPCEPDVCKDFEEE